MFVRIALMPGLVGGEALLQLGQRRARVFGAHRRKPQRVAALGEPVQRCRETCRSSLPSRNATSGSISSADASVLAFFAIRCDSTASWFA